MLPQSMINLIVNNTTLAMKQNQRQNTIINPRNSIQNNSQIYEDESQNQTLKADGQIKEDIPQQLLQEHVSLSVPEDSQMVVNILKKPIKTKHEINFIKKAFQSLDIWRDQQNLFSQSNSFNNTIFSHMKVQHVQKGEVIFNYGDTGTIYYIVAKGSFSCLIPKSTKEQQKVYEIIKEEQMKIAKKRNSIIIKQKSIKVIAQNAMEELMPIRQYIKPSDRQPSSEELIYRRNNINKSDDLQSSLDQSLKNKILKEFEAEDADEERIYKIFYPSFYKIKIYFPGESFGEIALLTQQKERKASIISREDGILITLDKSKFDKILNIFKELKIRNNLEFLQSFSFFSELGPSKLLSLLHTTQIVTIQKPYTIYKEGDKADNIYFIKSGEIKLTKIGQIIDDKQIEQRQKDLAENQPINLNKIKQQQARSQSQTRVSLVIYRENCFFGEDEIMNNLDIRNTRAEIHSIEAEIFIINKQKLIDNLKSSNVFDILVKEHKIKNKWRSQQYQNILNQKLDTVNQQYSEIQRLKGQELKQSFIEKINQQIQETGTFFSVKQKTTDRQASKNYNDESNSALTFGNKSSSPGQIHKLKIQKNELMREQSIQDYTPLVVNKQNSNENKELSPSPQSINKKQNDSQNRRSFINNLKVVIQNQPFRDEIKDLENQDRDQLNSSNGNQSPIIVEKSPKLKSYMQNQNRDIKYKDTPRNVDKKKIPYIFEESIKVQDYETIFSPLHRPARIPPELSAQSLNEVLEEKNLYKQNLLQQWEKKNKSSSFFITLDPHSKKLQELDIFKMKKEKSQPVFQKNNLKQHKGSQANSPSVGENTSKHIMQNANFSQYYSEAQKQTPPAIPIQETTTPYHLNSYFQSAQPNTIDSNNTSVDEKYPIQHQSNVKIQNDGSNTKFIKNTGNTQYTVDDNQSMQIFHNIPTTSSKQQFDNYNLNNSNRLLTNLSQQSHESNHNLYLLRKQQRNKILNEPQQGNNNTIPLSLKSQSTSNIFSRKNYGLYSQNSIQFNYQTIDSFRNLSNSQRSHRQLSSQQLMSEQIAFSHKHQQSMQSIQLEQKNMNQQLLQFNNLDVKHIDIQQKPQTSCRQRRGQQLSDFQNSRNEQYKSQSQQFNSTKNSIFNYSPSQTTYHSDQKQNKFNSDLYTDTVKEGGQLNVHEKIRNLEKQVKYINLKKLFKDGQNQRLFRYQDNKQIQMPDRKNSDKFNPLKNEAFQNETKLSSPQQNHTNLYQKLSPSSILPLKNNNTFQSLDLNQQLQPASFLIASQLQIHKLKQGVQNA